MAGRIVVGVDGSEHGREALRFALAEARLRDSRLELVHSWSIPPLTATGVGLIPVLELLRTELRDEAAETLETELAHVGGETQGVVIERHVAQGDAAGALVERAAGADLLVVGSRGRGGVAGTVLGSVSRACLRHAAGPVAVVHTASPTERTRIVVGVDGSPGAGVALDWAYAEARLRADGVHAVCAYEEPWGLTAAGVSAAGALAELRAALAEEAKLVVDRARDDAPDGVGVTCEIVQGPPGQALVAAAEGSALLVVGSRGRGGFRSLLLGSVSEQCAARSRGVVVVVRPSGG